VKSILLSLGVCYLAKLSEEGRKDFGKHVNDELRDLIDKSSFQYSGTAFEHACRLINR